MTDEKKPASGQGKPQHSNTENRNNSGYGDKSPRSNRSGFASDRRSYQGDRKPAVGHSRSVGDGERRYGKPASTQPSGERRSFDKPAYGKPSGERRSFDKPAYGQPSGERRSYDKPAYGKPSGERRSYDKPAYGKPSGERRSFDKPAYGKPSGERRSYDNPAYGKPSGERRSFDKPAYGKPSGERRSFDKPAYGQPSGERRSFDKPAYGQPSGERRSFDKPAYGKPSGERRSFDRPAYGKPSGERRSFDKPAYGQPSGERRSFDKPAYGKPSGERRSFDKPAYGQPSGERRSYDQPAYGKPSGERRSFDKPAYGKPSGERRSFDKPAYGKPSGERRSFDKPAYGKPSGERRSFDKPAYGQPSGERRYGKPAPAGSTQEPVETTGLSISARRVALDVLGDVHQNGAFASLSLDKKLREAHLRPEDRRLVTSIVYGTLENEIRIDHALDKLMDHPTHEPVQRDILRMSAYQILFLDRVPDSAACNEGVNLVKAMGMESAAGFINAVLRNLVRGKETLEEPKREDDLREYLHIMGSMPTWIVDKLIAAYGEEEAEKLIMQRSTEHPIVVRPNLTSMSDDEFEKLLEKKEWRYEHGLAPHAFLTYGVQEMTYDKDYQDGHFTIQGQSSMLAAQAVEAKAGMKILDACAAPGGKSAYMCECMQMTGRVFAWELHEKRSLLLEGVKRRLKLDNLRISVRDATEYKQDMDRTLDAVLLDAPCSGLGVMLQKPDIKLRMKEEDLTAIVKTQKNLLETLSSYVKPGGLFVYSTCSILPEENTEQIEAFLQAHPEYTVDPLPESFPEAIRAKQTPLGVQLLSSQDGVEGFFIVRMQRKR